MRNVIPIGHVIIYKNLQAVYYKINVIDFCFPLSGITERKLEKEKLNRFAKT